MAPFDIDEKTLPLSAPASDGSRWAAAEAVLAPGTWGTLGTLSFPKGKVADDLYFVTGVVSQDGKPISEEVAENVSIWCPDVAARWLPLASFREAARATYFSGDVCLWARNDSSREVQVLVRARYREGKADHGAPDATAPYYASKVWKKSTWFGSPVLKHPCDLWTLQEILFDVKPRLVVEAGTLHGGSGAYLACLLDLIHGEDQGQGEDAGIVLSADVVKQPVRPSHPRLFYAECSSTDERLLADARRRIEEDGMTPVLVLLDSDHSYDHVLAELRAYGPLVTEGSYIVVEDTNTPGPAEAVAAFLASPEGEAFEVDSSREKHGTSFNPGGFLRKKTIEKKIERIGL